MIAGHCLRPIEISKKDYGGNPMSIDARKESFDLIQLDGTVCLFTNDRIDRSTVPDGLQCYDVRDSDQTDGSFAEINRFVLVNHWGTILCKHEFPMNEIGCYYPRDVDAVFLDRSMGVEEFLACREDLLMLDSFYIGAIKVYTENGQKYCQFPDEDKPRLYRETIQDIQAGDAFLAWGSIRIAESASHRNSDEPDSPWVVYDDCDGSWFEEDISANPLSSPFFHRTEAVDKSTIDKIPLEQQLGEATSRMKNNNQIQQSTQTIKPTR